MTLLIVLSIWFIGCLVLCLANYRYHTQNPDLEDLTYLELKAQNKPFINPVKQDNKHLLLLFLLVVGLIAVVWLILNSID